MNLKKIEKVFASKFVGTGPSSYKKRIYLAAVSQILRNTNLKSEATDVYDVYVVYEQSYPSETLFSVRIHV